MKIAVVGCGAVGSYYGARLSRDGQDVHFLLRSDYDAVRRNGVRISSPQGNFEARPKPARTAEEIGLSDLVVIALKTTANHEFAKLLPPLVGKATVLLTLQNGLGNEEQLARMFPRSQIIGGLCFVCINRLAPGIIHHLDHGLIVMGEFQGWPEPLTHDVATIFRHAGIPCKVTENLAQAHWEKLVWNIPFNGLGVAGAAGFEALLGAPLNPPGPCLTTDKLLTEARWEGLVRELMHEVISTGRALGFPIDRALAEKQIERTRTMGAYKASTLIDFERGQPLELENLFLEPLRQARQVRVPTPRLEALCRVLQELDPEKARV